MTLKDTKDISLSVCMITYGHETFIMDALNGILMQKVTFPVEVIISDDCSPDNTSVIINNFIRTHPNGHWIKYIRHTQNMGMMKNFTWTLKQCSSKYIAYCEGDDYWTDQNKLQKQVDFLEENLTFSCCFHSVYTLLPNNKFDYHSRITDKDATYTILDLAKRNVIQPLSVVFRNHIFQPLPDWLPEAPIGDYVLHLLNARHGNFRLFAKPMGVYRLHNGGVWASQSKKSHQLNLIKLLDFLLQEDFDAAVLEELRLQRKKRIIKYLKILWKENKNHCLESLQVYATTDQELAEEWRQIHYPKLINQSHYSFVTKIKLMLVKIPFLKKCATRLNVRKQKPAGS